MRLACPGQSTSVNWTSSNGCCATCAGSGTCARDHQLQHLRRFYSSSSVCTLIIRARKRHIHEQRLQLIGRLRHE
jgi:hypothetical protein